MSASVKGLAKRMQNICSPYDMRTVFTSGSTLRRYLFRVKPPTEFNMIKNCVYSITCSCGKTYKGETGRPLKVRLEEHRKAVVRGEIEKSGITDHIWKEKGNHLPLWDEVEIVDRVEHWRIRLRHRSKWGRTPILPICSLLEKASTPLSLPYGLTVNTTILQREWLFL